MQNRKTSLFTLSLVLAMACQRTSPDTSPPSPVSSDLPATNTRPDEPAEIAVAARPKEAEVKAPPAHLTNDDEIFGVLKVINDEVIEQAEYAQKWAMDQRVKEYAALMMTDHGAFRKRENETRERLGLRRSDSRLADEIKSDSKQKKEILKKSSKGEPFDKTYVDIQVEAHRTWIEYIDTKLMPHAQMPDLRVELSNFRDTLQRHYDLARDIQANYPVPKT